MRVQVRHAPLGAVAANICGSPYATMSVFTCRSCKHIAYPSENGDMAGAALRETADEPVRWECSRRLSPPTRWGDPSRWRLLPEPIRNHAKHDQNPLYQQLDELQILPDFEVERIILIVE